MVTEEVKKTIFIAGFMGTGKTSVGKRLSKYLGQDFVDTDEIICKSNSCKNTEEFFSKEGEGSFRKEEKKVILELANSEKVISIGGGSDQDSDIKNFLKKQHVVRLVAPIEEIEKRIGNGNDRPLWDQRYELYKKREDHNSLGIKINTSGRSIGEVVSLVLRTLGKSIEIINKKHNIIFGWGSSSHSIDENHWVGVAEDNLSSYSFAFPKGAVQVLNFEGSEKAKNYKNVEMMLKSFKDLGLSRDGCVVVMGGGAISDVVGFASSIHLRGVPVHLIPTTLLSMVDAAIGGKFAVNIDSVKNLAGSFHLPKSIRIDSSFLPTLPYGEYISGTAEMLKMSCLDKVLFDDFSKDIEKIKDQNLIILNEYIKRVIALKCDYVEGDVYDNKGRRIFLNFGHTVGHAIELAASRKIRHGEAVSLGMLAISKWAELEGLTKKGTAKTIEEKVKMLGLPTNIKPFDVDPLTFVDSLQKDKKWTSGGLNVVYPKEIGNLKVCNLANPPAEKWLDLIS